MLFTPCLCRNRFQPTASASASACNRRRQQPCNQRATHLKSHSHMVLWCSLLSSRTPVQAMTLIGKQGSLIKSIQESTGASVRVLPGDETLSSAAPDEKIVELHGEALKVAKALEAVIGQL